jgi:molybdenum cofactor cytidylyltransferase
VKLAVIVLSAGASQRMGQPKALLHIEGRSLLGCVVEKALALPGAEVVVALAAPHGERLRAELTSPGHLPLGAALTTAWNPHPERGMLSSVQCALSQLEPRASALAGALIWPVDIPRVQPATLLRIVEAAARQTRPVVPTYGGRGGHPLWLPRALFAETQSLPVEGGLRALRQRHPPCFLPVEDEEILRDFDTPEDLRRVQAAPAEGAARNREPTH